MNGASVAVFNTHLQAHDGPLSEKMRADQLSKLSSFIDKHRSTGEPVIVLGDFNAPRRANCGAVSEYCNWMSDAKRYGDWSGFVDHAPETPLKHLDYILSLPGKVGVEVPVQSRWVYVTANAGATQLEGRAPASTASLQKIRDHPLVYGAFEASPLAIMPMSRSDVG